MTPAGIEPETFRFLTQHLNHCATAVPSKETVNGKSKLVPLQTWRDPEGSRNLKFPDFVTTAHVGSKFVSLTHRPPLPQEILWYSFLLEAQSTPGP